MEGDDRRFGGIDIVEAEELLLSSANEDYTGLYEAIWELNAKYGAATLGAKYGAAEEALRRLHSKGFIEFHRMVFTDDYQAFSYKGLDESAVDEMLSNPVSWYPDYDHVRIVFSATPAGERVYCSRRRDAGTTTAE